MAVVASLVATIILPAAASAAEPVACAEAVEAKAVAAAMARDCDAPVEVLGLRTEQDQLWALPDGSWKTERHYRPVRVKQAGGWVPVDTTLRFVADGSVVPVATTAQMVFSGGGNAPLVRLSASGHTLEVGAPFGALPKPVLDGNKATYPEVLPGVDLRLTADVEGYTEVLIVKNRKAAANPALSKITFPVSGPGLTTTTDEHGNVRVVDDKGAIVWGGAAPMMWDAADEVMATTDPGLIDRLGKRPKASLRTVVASASGVARAAGVAGSPGERSQVSVLPSREYLDDPATVYPVMIDPPQTNYKMNWTYVSEDCGGCTFWNSSDPAHTGPIGGHRHNSYFMMSMSGLQYKNIISAHFVIDLWWTASSYWKETDLHDAGSIYSWTSWNAQPDKRAYLGTVTLNAPANGVSWDITGQLRYASSHNWGDQTLGLYSRNDYDWAYGKQWSNNPAMVVVWNDPPYTPAPQALYATTDCYKACGSPAVVRTATPKLRAQLSDPNNDLVRGDFEVRNAASDTATLLASATTGAVTSWSTVDWQVPTGVLSNGSTVYWRVRARDAYDWLSGWSGWQALTVDLSTPSTPAVSSTEFPYKAWGAVVGAEGTFALSSGSLDTAEFEWWVDGGPHTTTSATGTSPRTASVSWTPSTDMVHTLHVKAKDNAGNVSSTYDYQFWVSPAAEKFAHWKLDETSGTTAADSGSGGSALSPGTLGGPTTWVTGYLGGAVNFGGVNARVTTAGPVLDTTKSFTVMAWVRPTDLAATGKQTIIAQNGDTASRFELQFQQAANGGAGGWCFVMTGDNSGGTPVSACADGQMWGVPTEGDWVHVAGRYDETTGMMSILVMGGDESCSGEYAEGAAPAAWSATGSFAIGRGWSGGAGVSYWRGDIDDVYAHQRALSDVEICLQAVQ